MSLMTLCFDEYMSGQDIVLRPGGVNLLRWVVKRDLIQPMTTGCGANLTAGSQIDYVLWHLYLPHQRKEVSFGI